MRISDFFRYALEDGKYGDCGGRLCEFWHVIEGMARQEGARFSSLDDYEDPDERACPMCGRIQHTDKFGRVANICEDETCQTIAAYFKIYGHGRLLYMTGGKMAEPFSARKSWLNSRLGRFNSINENPHHLRCSILLSLMLERVCFEKQTSRGEFKKEENHEQ